MSDQQPTMKIENTIKPWWKSKTMWVSIITIVAGAFSGLVDQNLVTNPKIVSVILTVVGILNLVLRMVTSTPVVAKKPTAEPK